MRNGQIHKSGPEQREHNKGTELDPFYESPAGQSHSNRREGELKGTVNELRNGTRQGTYTARAQALQEDPASVSDKASCNVIAKGQGVTIYDPDYGGEGVACKDHGHGVYLTGLVGEAAVVEGQAGNRHQHDQGRGSQDPGSVTAVYGEVWGGVGSFYLQATHTCEDCKHTKAYYYYTDPAF